MSKIALTPNASGSGTFTIASPNSDTDRTLTLPDEAGTVLTSASDLSGLTGIPTTGEVAFFARSTSLQSIPDSTRTVIEFNTALINTGSGYSTSTHDFTVPSGQGGLYLFGSQVRIETSAANNSCFLTLLINSTAVSSNWYSNTYYESGTLTYLANLSAGDVAEVDFYHNQGTSRTVGTNDPGYLTYFWGVKLA